MPTTDIDTRHLHIEFFVEAHQNLNKTREAGRPIYDDKEMVRIKFVGDPKKELVEFANVKFMRDPQSGEWIDYRQAYHRHYDAFKTGEAIKGSGTPLEELPFITAAKRAELKHLNIHTAEALAQLEGPSLTRVGMYARELKNQAQAYLDRARENATDARLAAVNAALMERIAALEAQIASGGATRAVESVAPEEPASNSTFDSWPDAELKAFIKDQTGRAPAGQPSHATLVRLAEEANAKVAA